MEQFMNYVYVMPVMVNVAKEKYQKETTIKETSKEEGEQH